VISHANGSMFGRYLWTQKRGYTRSIFGFAACDVPGSILSGLQPVEAQPYRPMT